LLLVVAGLCDEELPVATEAVRITDGMKTGVERELTVCNMHTQHA